MFDIDYFKFYNDNYGHQHGDEVLKQIGAILAEMVQKPNCASRYGGDEFTILVPDNEIRAMELAEQIKDAIEAYPFLGAEIQPKGKLTVSVGVSTFPKQGKTPKELIRLTDEALYKSKYSKNKVQLYFSVMDDLREGVAETERDLFNSVKTLVSIINAKDRYTFGHSERVVYYSVRLGEQLNLSKEDMILLRFGAFLHDIGKIEVDREVLNRIGPLKNNEWAALKKHPVWGGDIVRPIISLRKAIPAVLHHHENFDGTGYPDGLAGEEIPLFARILRIADSFDAMTTDRPYKKAKTFEEACAELRRCKGMMFDPGLVDLFITAIEKEGNILPAFKDPDPIS
jgi:diguanylate cyclase (GGDEF)-like protein